MTRHWPYAGFRQLAGALGVGALLAALVACSRQPAAPVRAESGVTLVQAAGAVSREAAGKAPAPAAPGALAIADRLVTGNDGSAVVRLPDGRELQVGPGTRLRLVSASPGELEVQIEEGSIVARQGQAAAEVPMAVRVLTPFGVTRLPAGPGETAIAVRAAGATMTVALGSIEFVDRAGATTRAGAGDSLEVSIGGVQLIAAGTAAGPAAAEAGSPGNAAGETIPVRLSSDRGPLMVRPPGSREFRRQRALTAPTGTAYRVPGADGRARLEAAGLRAVLAGGSAGQVGEARHVDGADRFELALQSGSALVQLEGPSELRLPVGADHAALRAGGNAAVKLVRARGALTMAVLLGDIEVELAGRRRRVGAGEAVELSPRGIAAAPRPGTAITLPTARGLQVHAEALDEVTLSWPADLANARLEVASDPQFTDILLAGEPGRPAVSVPSPRRGDLHWRISGERNGAPVTLVGSARFLPDRGRSVLDLANPQNLVSETGEVTTVYFQSVLPAVTLSFASRPGARRYRVRIYRAQAMDRPVVERELAGTECALEAGTLHEGRYLWHATALDSQGRETSGGLMNKLELVYDNALNTLAIGSPKPGARVSGPDVQVSGIAPIGSKLFVNGQPALLDDKGRFDMRVQRTPAVIFRLLENDGSQRYWVRALRLRS